MSTMEISDKIPTLECSMDLPQTRLYPAGIPIMINGRSIDSLQALKLIIAAHINTSTQENVVTLSKNRETLADTLLDAWCQLLEERVKEVSQMVDESEKELIDLEHTKTIPVVNGYPLTNENKLRMWDIEEKVAVNRRYVKDVQSILYIFLTNMRKTRNFVLGMKKRKYSPKSKRFQRDDLFDEMLSGCIDETK